MISTIHSLDVWVVYEKPLDFPESYIARRWRATSTDFFATPEIRQGETLHALRQQLPPGLHRLARDPNDDAVIVEVWM